MLQLVYIIVIISLLLSLYYCDETSDYLNKYNLRSNDISKSNDYIRKQNKTSKYVIPLIYDRTAKIKISLDRIGASISDKMKNENKIKLKLTTNGMEYLSEDIYYTTVLSDSLIISLNPRSRWVDLSNRIPPVGLVLSSIVDSSIEDNAINYLKEPIIIARIINVPNILESSKQLDYNESYLFINGTGLIGGQLTRIVFDPYLEINKDYVISSSIPLVNNYIKLRLLFGYHWRDSSGPLKIMAIDTGGGLVKVNGDIGKTIAIVNAYDNININISGSSDIFPDRLDYHFQQLNRSNIEIKSNQSYVNNKSDNNRISYTNISSNINNTLDSKVISADRSKENIKSYENKQATTNYRTDNLDSKAYIGIYKDMQSIYNTELNLAIFGKNLLTYNHIFLKFNNHNLLYNVNYTMDSLTNQVIFLKLIEGSLWFSNYELSNGPQVISIIAADSGTGYLPIQCLNRNQVYIANECIVANIYLKPTITSSEPEILDRNKDKVIVIHGSGFIPYRTKLQIYPNLIDGTDYSIDVVDSYTLRIELLPNKQWGSNNHGDIYIHSINTLDHDKGWVQINRKISSYSNNNYNTNNDIIIYPFTNNDIFNSIGNTDITIIGQGFISNNLTTISLDNNNIRIDSDYQLIVKSDNLAILSLYPGHRWVKNVYSNFPYQLKITSYNNINSDITIANVLDNLIIQSNNNTINNRFINIQLKPEFTSKIYSGIPISSLDINLFPTPKRHIVIGSYDLINPLNLTIQLIGDSAWLPDYLTNSTNAYPLQVYSLTINNNRIVYDDPIVIGYISNNKKSINSNNYSLLDKDLCDDSCESSHNGICEDPTNSHYNNTYSNDLSKIKSMHVCKQGTDCSDCNGIDSNRHDIQQLIHAASQHLESKLEEEEPVR